MDHLTPEQFVDLVDGGGDPAWRDHVASCRSCRNQLESTRAMLAEAADVTVPEPSPLFWDRLSARVRLVIDEERLMPSQVWRLPSLMPRPAWWRAALSPAGTLAAAAATALLVGVVLLQRAGPAPPPPAGDARAADVERTVDASLPPSDDPSFDLIADLIGDDWEATAAGLSLSARAADLLVEALDEDERAALERLLQQELGAQR
jgi:hypothetical protein